MLNPGGLPSNLFPKSAQTRFTNSQRNASRATMVGNPAAQQSIRNQTSLVSGAQPGVVQHKQQPPNVQQGALPTGGPAMPEEAAEQFDPAVFLESQINDFVGKIKLENFMESPRVKDAMESIRLKNIMNADNPRYRKSPKSLFKQVVDKIGMGDEP